jgi:hypothetical protein
MNAPSDSYAGKVPAVTLAFWVIKIAATTLGETGGDAVTMSMNLGYLIGTLIFAVLFLIAVAAQIRAKKFHPFLYWAVIIATTTTGTTLADFADRSLGIGYAGGSTLLLALLLVTFAVWYWTQVQSPLVQSPHRKRRFSIGSRFSSLKPSARHWVIGLPTPAAWASAAVRSCSAPAWRWWLPLIGGPRSRTLLFSGLLSF